MKTPAVTFQPGAKLRLAHWGAGVYVTVERSLGPHHFLGTSTWRKTTERFSKEQPNLPWEMVK